MRIQITPGGPASLYQQIVDQVQRAIAAGRVAVGDELPSVRQLAKELTVNPNTVAKAYSRLVQEGFLASQPGRGYVVAKRRNVYSKAERLRRLDAAVDSLIQEAIALDFTPPEVGERLEQRLHKLMPQPQESPQP